MSYTNSNAIIMHDWTLMEIRVDWQNGSVTVTFRNTTSREVSLTAEGLVDIHVPKKEEWGRSVSVNEIRGPYKFDNEFQKVTIEMQSGDSIKIVARSIVWPQESPPLCQ